MPYSDLIKQEGEYNYSVNIQFDVENDIKLSRFIPNKTTVEMLREYFNDFTRANPEHHARILTGSYGTGKSHFLTVLSLLLEKKHTDGEGYYRFQRRIRKYDEDLATAIDAYIFDSNRKPLLIVPIVFDFPDFNRCIYFSLKKKLDSIGAKASFKTFYDQAITLIEKWKEHDDSLERLNQACKKAGVKLSSLESMLKSLDKKAEPKFEKVFTEMTFGVKFLYEVSNIEEIINQANTAISNNYSGIVFIFDEFGRYIEDNIKSIKVASVQAIAETCDHATGNNSIILVSHKEISQYTQKYGKVIANEWKKVEGRYKSTPISDHQDQCLSLVNNVLVRDAAVWQDFSNRFRRELDKMYSETFDFKGFLVDHEKKSTSFEGGFPIHPIALYALDKLSKKVAQNDRTFFTFLASNDDHSLYQFLKQNELDCFHFVGIDAIYDYFEPSIKSAQSDGSYEWYRKLQTALSKTHSNTEALSPDVKILKVIATIGIINDATVLNADKSTILRVIDCPDEVLINALQGLCERRIIKYSGAYNKYDFFEASIFDVETMIAEESRLVTDDAVITTLNEDFIGFVLYPYSYNRKFKISRAFIPVFAQIENIQKKSFFSRLGDYYDGILIMLLATPDTNIDDIIKSSKTIDRSIILANTDSHNLIAETKRFIAVRYLESQKTDYICKDPAFEKELAYFKEEIATSISNAINNWRTAFGSDTVVVVDGALHSTTKTYRDLSELASTISNDCYGKTLIVNNELINKNTISGSIMTAKKAAINAMLAEKPSKNYFDLPPLSPDYIAVRSVLAKNGFITIPTETITQNALSDGDQPQLQIKSLLSRYIKRGTSGIVEFESLYRDLKAPPYGLRDGYLSLLLACELLPYRKSIIISSHDVEQELTVDLFEEIIHRPSDYTFQIALLSNEQQDYINILEQIFSDYIRDSALAKNRTKAIFDGMLSHYKNVSKFSRTTKVYVSSDTQKYRQLMEKSTTNYSSFLFSKLNAIGGGTFDNTIRIVKQAKAELESALQSLINELSISILILFDAPPQVSIAYLLSAAYKAEWAEKRKKSFDYYTNSFLEFCSNLTGEEADIETIPQLSKILTGFELIYWNDEYPKEFVAKLAEIKRQLDEYKLSPTLLGKETKMTLSTSDGYEKSIVFDRSELSEKSQTVKNKISTTFSNFGLSITYDDKVQVLLSLLEDLIEGI